MTAVREIEKIAKPYLQLVDRNGRIDVPEATDEEIERAFGQLSGKGLRLARGEVDEGEDRSARLFELAAICSESGVGEAATFHILRSSSNNKFRGRDDEALRLWEAIERSGSHAKTRHNATRTRLAKSIGTLLARNTVGAEWIVDGIWEHRGWGFVAGEPKTYKSTFTTDLAVSIAAGSPFLGHFDVCKTGPVLIVQEENSEGIQHARLRRIMEHKEMGGKIHSLNDSLLEFTPPHGDCPVYCIDRSRFSFNNAQKRRALEADIKTLQPALVILDPIQRMMGDYSIRDEKDVSKCLDWMDQIVHDYKTGLLVVHHYNKGREEGPKRGGQRMLGSQALHAWLSCGLYLERLGSGNGGIRVTREFRAFDSGTPFELEFDSHDDEDFYSVHVVEPDKSKGKRSQELDEIVRLQPGITVKEVSTMLEWDEKRVRQRVKALGLRVVRGKMRENGSRESSKIYPTNEIGC